MVPMLIHVVVVFKHEFLRLLLFTNRLRLFNQLVLFLVKAIVCAFYLLVQILFGCIFVEAPIASDRTFGYLLTTAF